MPTSSSPHNITWTELTDLEPRLGDLRNEALAVEADAGSGFCKERCFEFGYADRPGFRERINALVGCYRAQRPPLLCTAAARQVARRMIRASLPWCPCCRD